MMYSKLHSLRLNKEANDANVKEESSDLSPLASKLMEKYMKEQNESKLDPRNVLNSAKDALYSTFSSSSSSKNEELFASDLAEEIPKLQVKSNEMERLTKLKLDSQNPKDVIYADIQIQRIQELQQSREKRAKWNEDIEKFKVSYSIMT